MKKLLTLLLSALCAWTLTALTETVNGITWDYTVSNGEAKIYKNTFSPAIPSSTSGAITIPSTLGGYPVTSIGDSAFEDCDSLTSVTIPEGVTSIGDYALAYCYDLISVTIPEGVTEIGDSAFYNCSSLTSVTIPSSVTYIDSSAFVGCSNVKITVDSANSFYVSSGGALFNKSMTELIRGPGATSNYTIPEGVTSIGWEAFAYCRSLTSVTIPEGVTSIGWGRFMVVAV